MMMHVYSNKILELLCTIEVPDNSLLLGRQTSLWSFELLLSVLP